MQVDLEIFGKHENIYTFLERRMHIKTTVKSNAYCFALYLRSSFMNLTCVF